MVSDQADSLREYGRSMKGSWCYSGKGTLVRTMRIGHVGVIEPESEYHHWGPNRVPDYKPHYGIPPLSSCILLW